MAQMGTYSKHDPVGGYVGIHLPGIMSTRDRRKQGKEENKTWKRREQCVSWL
jgi:hypothetical protein